MQGIGVRYETPAQKSCDDALEKWDRADEAIQTIEWTIGRDPKAGEALTESGNSRSLTLDGARSVGFPKVTVVYEITPIIIIFHSMKFEDATYAQAGRA